MTQPDKPPGGGKLLVELGPLAVFFIAYRVGGVLAATASFMVAVTLGLAFMWWKERRLPPMMVATAIIVLIFGGLTVGLKDPRFIYLKPTIISGLGGLVLLGGLATGRPLLKSLLGSAMTMDDAGWRALSLRFGLFWLGLAGLNELVWRSVTPAREDLWVWFKILGIPGLTLLFMLTQAGLMRRHAIEPVEPAGPPEPVEPTGPAAPKEG
jgi:intracellular septation protein